MLSVATRMALCCGLVAALAQAPAAASPALLFDPDSDAVFYAEDADRLWHPASLTKLMTSYLTFEALRDGKIAMDTTMTCSELAHAQPPSKIGLPVGGEMSVELGLKSILIKSANDVSVMLAETVAGSEEAFVARMNETAARLGMARTRFHNPNGLPHDGQVTTARDMGLLARALMRDFPEYAHFFALEDMRIGNVRLRNYNTLLRNFEGADGMKTGFICASGYNLVASATRGDRRLVAVVLGGRTGQARDERTTRLLEHGFQRYEWKEMFASSLDMLPMPASLSEQPANLRGDICRPRPAAAKPAAKPRPRASSATRTIKDVKPNPSFAN